MPTPQQTSYGTVEKLHFVDGDVVAEVSIFEKEGHSHIHEKWEFCTVLSGEGVIVIVSENGDQVRHHVKVGGFLAVPPERGHWMIPNESGNKENPYTVLITYAETFDY